MKIFVLDTNVLLNNPEAIFGFEENTVIIPVTVLEELDKFKGEQNGIGRNAREAIRHLDALRKEHGFSTYSPTRRYGIPLPNGGNLYVFFENAEFQFPGFKPSNDNYILGAALRLSNAEDVPVILVTQDINLRLKAEALGVKSEEYKRAQVKETRVGLVRQVYVSRAVINALYADTSPVMPSECFTNISLVSRPAALELAPIDFFNGEYVTLKSTDAGVNALAKWTPGGFVRVNSAPWFKEELFSVRPRNAEQRVFLDALLDPDIDLVICAGDAGCGKTLLSMAAGLHGIEAAAFDRMMITKSIMPVGRDLGFLPGSKEEKLAEWLKPFDDNLEYLLRGQARRIQEMKDRGQIEVDAMTYVRGRSLMGRFVVVDEAQNLMPSEVRTIVTRIGAKSKLVLLGDPSQIDNPYMDEKSNGLTTAMCKFKGQPNVAVLYMTKSERSRLAKLAIKVM